MKKLILLIFSLTVVFATFSNYAKAETSEKIEIRQVGTSGGVPAIQAKLHNGSTVGTYQLVIKNDKTGTTFAQTLITGKQVIFAISNFTHSGTYSYVLQNNGVEVLKGGVNLTSAKRTPEFKAHQKGSDLSIKLANATDYSGQRMFFNSGSYSNSFTVSDAKMEAKFSNVSGTAKTITFSDSKGKLVRVNLTKSKGESSNNSNNNNDKDDDNESTNTQKPNNNKPSGNNDKPSSNDNGGSTSKPSKPDSGNSNVAGQEEENTTTVGTKKNSISLTLNKLTFELEEYIVAKVTVTNTKYAGQPVTVRLGADASSTTALVDLNQKGVGKATFKITVPQPSSNQIVATSYSMSGKKLSATSESYSIIDEVEGVKPDKLKPGSGDSPYAEYVALDLRKLESETAILSWYDARNISKFKTRLTVTNETTGVSHSYEVFIIDGDSKIKLKLAFDGPGIYTWKLKAGNKLVAKAPFGTPLAVDGTPVSNNGLPVIKTLANKDSYDSNLDGIGEVGASDLGEEVGGEVADDLTTQDAQTDLQAQNIKADKKNNMFLYLGIIIFALAIIVFILLMRKKRKSKNDEAGRNQFVEYKEGDDDTDFEDEAK